MYNTANRFFQFSGPFAPLSRQYYEVPFRPYVSGQLHGLPYAALEFRLLPSDVDGTYSRSICLVHWQLLLDAEIRVIHPSVKSLPFDMHFRSIR